MLPGSTGLRLGLFYLPPSLHCFVFLNLCFPGNGPAWKPDDVSYWVFLAEMSPLTPVCPCHSHLLKRPSSSIAGFPILLAVWAISQLHPPHPTPLKYSFYLKRTSVLQCSKIGLWSFPARAFSWSFCSPSCNLHIPSSEQTLPCAKVHGLVSKNSLVQVTSSPTRIWLHFCYLEHVSPKLF